VCVGKEERLRKRVGGKRERFRKRVGVCVGVCVCVCWKEREIQKECEKKASMPSANVFERRCVAVCCSVLQCVAVGNAVS